MLSDNTMLPEDREDYDPYLDDPYDDEPYNEPVVGEREDELDEFDHVRDQYGTMHVLKASQGIVRILGRDEIKLGMTCDVEHGHARQMIEVEIVGTTPTDKRLVTVERTDGKKWEHHKTHTRIVRP